MAQLTLEGLTKKFSANTPFEKIALRDINLTIPQGQFVGLLGHTGSGKSTLVQHFNALYQPTEGRVLFGGEDINATKESRCDIKRKVGLVFQYPEYQLFEETVFKDIAFGPKNMGLTGDELSKCVLEAAEFTGVDSSLFEKSPLELSGGQKRRIAIAGVIAMRPEILVLDEPTAGLDPEGCREILGNICTYREKTGATIIIISHNMDDIARLAERIIVLNGGTLAMDGTTAEVFSCPQKLRELGLDVPKSTEMAMLLGLEGSIYTHEGLLSAIKARKGEGKC